MLIKRLQETIVAYLGPVGLKFDLNCMPTEQEHKHLINYTPTAQ